MGCKKRPLEDKNGVTPKRIKTAGKESDSNCGNDEHSGAARRRLSSLKSFQMNLIPEQMAVINAIRAGKSVFFTGSAGTGKSYLLKRLITMLPPQSTFITASAGAAACHIGGTTLHAFAGVFPLQECRGAFSFSCSTHTFGARHIIDGSSEIGLLMAQGEEEGMKS